ncbi:MAG: DUF58 domain-containing protein [Kiritimatiellia bacterium]|nr:DUF58 domain-containing protein [Kiritimatiellia bacterium]MDP6847562.1 DUF58 domain-containing protein [Kiritimatiellia bacterium]
MARFADRDFIDSAVVARLSRLQVNAATPMLGSVTGIHKSATRGSSVEFAEYRKYVPGDDIKHVDWRVYARSDRFYMKEFEADTNLRCHIILDTSASMSFEAEHGRKFDYARRMAATLAYLLVHQGDGVGLHCFADKIVHDIPPRRTPSHLKNIFDTLAVVEPAGKTEVVKVIHDLAERISQRALVVVFSDFFTEVAPLLDCFQHMRYRKHDLAVFHLLDRQELDFKFDRPIRFDDAESTFKLITDPSVVREGYRRAIDDYLSDMLRGCREFNVDYQRVMTDEDYEKSLAAFLLQRMRMT